MGEGDRPTFSDLLAEQRHHRPRRAQHVAEAHHGQAGGGQLLGQGLDHQLGSPLGGAHHVGGAHGLIGGDQREASHTRASCGAGQHQGAEHVVGQAGEGIGLHQGHVFVGGGVEHHLYGLLLQHAAGQLAIGGATEHGHELHIRGEAAAQLLIDGVEAGFAALEQHQAAGPERQDLTAELGADRATGATHQHHLAGDARAEQLGIGRHGVTAEELFDSNRAQGINAGAAAGDLLHRGHLQHGDAEGSKIVNDAAALAAAEGGNRQQHLIHIAEALAQDLGRLDGDAVDVAPPEAGFVV